MKTTFILALLIISAAGAPLDSGLTSSEEDVLALTGAGAADAGAADEDALRPAEKPIRVCGRDLTIWVAKVCNCSTPQPRTAQNYSLSDLCCTNSCRPSTIRQMCCGN
ncbi:hypothetical protein PMAYCL1PPCAC_09678 [Pristionchus mayeri]|uniref:Uncharacterized protein n=1 Tax=Pristionchus mayeri TaxID=1317129 RepID=A0AAN5C6P6_9BILA|nr:hypothetical protein PMAYCL1PPCAC_09678 [Pristionchus mayeri]